MLLLSVCITGVDGTGKSTVVRRLHDLLGNEKSVVQYMGMKSWETKVGEKYLQREIHTYKDKIAYIYAQIRELRHRVYKHRGDSRLVIFDRYAHEQILQFDKSGLTWKNRPVKLLYQLFLSSFLYKPTLQIYLTCSIETSLARKEDIRGSGAAERLRQNKALLDKYYGEDANVFVIDTSGISEEKTLGMILEKMENMECFNTLMR